MRVLSASLRALPLVTKLALTLYMGRYFQLSEIGAYGLVVGAVAVINALLGQRLDYVVSRDIVGVEPADALHRMRDQALYYGANYLIFALAIALVVSTGITSVPTRILLFVLILAVLESAGDVTLANMYSLNQQVAANIIFFVRAGLWILPVLAQCALSPSMRTADTVFVGWIAGATVSLLATLWYWRRFPWREARLRPIDWAWLRAGLRKSSLIWLGVMGVMGVTYVDRVVVLHFLGIDFVGAMTFYASFANALYTLSESAVGTFVFPRLVALHRRDDKSGFNREARRALWQSAIATGIVGIGMAIVVPIVLGHFTDSILATETWTFWLILIGSWIRAVNEIQVRVLMARHQDRAVWLGNLIALLPAVAGNLLLVPYLGFAGVGYSAIAVSVFGFLWRRYHMNPARVSG